MTPVIPIAALLLAPALLHAREAPPAGGPPRPFTLPAKERFALPNGLQATLIPFGLLPKVAVSVVVRTGNLDEGQQTWLADLTGELMSEGTSALDGSELARAAARMGGAIGVAVGADQTSIGADVLSEFGPELVQLLADIVIAPRLPESELPRIRQDFQRNLAIARTQPQALAAEAFAAALYGDHPYGRSYPTEEQLAAYGIADVRAHHAANFGAARTEVLVAGRFDAAAMRAAIERAFGPWARGPDALIDIPSAAQAPSLRLIARPDAPQTTIYLGLPAIDPSHADYTALAVTNTLLGGFFSSRITRNLREDKGYAYSPSSRVGSNYRSAYWVQTADVTTAATGPALHEIFSEIDRLRSEPPGAEELERVQSYMTGIFVLGNASRAGLISQMAFLELHGLPDSYLEQYVARVRAVTPEQVRAAARTYLDRTRMTLVAVGNPDVVQQQLDALPELEGLRR
jgi:predicted Zn-dependent peptidase